MSRKKNFNHGASSGKSECHSCGEAIDITKSVHQMHNKDAGTTHHFDIEGEGVATEQHNSGWMNEHVEPGTYCPSCHDNKERGDDDYESPYDSSYTDPHTGEIDYK